jgi:hypothetical protein
MFLNLSGDTHDLSFNNFSSNYFRRARLQAFLISNCKPHKLALPSLQALKTFVKAVPVICAAYSSGEAQQALFGRQPP